LIKATLLRQKGATRNNLKKTTPLLEDSKRGATNFDVSGHPVPKPKRLIPLDLRTLRRILHLGTEFAKFVADHIGLVEHLLRAELISQFNK